MSKQIIGVIVFVIVVAGGVYVTTQKESSDSSSENTKEQVQPHSGNAAVQSQTYEVTYSDSGYSPSSVTIKKGDMVKFINTSSKDFWPASAMHPTHMAYPGSDIKKCGTAESQSIFDACSPHMQGTSWSFRFMEQGKWNYHDHLTASRYGSIIVE